MSKKFTPIIQNPEKMVSDDITSQFFLELRSGDINKVRSFITANKNKTNLIEPETKKTPYHVVLELDDRIADASTKLRLLHYLDSIGAPFDLPDADNQWPIHLAVQTQNEDIVKFFVNKKTDLARRDSSNNTPLHYAVVGPEIPCPVDIKPGKIIPVEKKETVSVGAIENLKREMMRQIIIDTGTVNNDVTNIIATIQKIPQMYKNTDIERDIIKKIIEVFRENPLDPTAVNVDEVRQQHYIAINNIVNSLTTEVTNNLGFNNATSAIPIEANNKGWGPTPDLKIMPTEISTEIARLKITQNETGDKILTGRDINIVDFYETLNKDVDKNIQIHTDMVFDTGKDVFYAKMLYLLLINNELAYDYRGNIFDQTREIIIESWIMNLRIMSEADYDMYINKKYSLPITFITEHKRITYNEDLATPQDHTHQWLCINTVNDADIYIKKSSYRPQAVHFFSDAINGLIKFYKSPTPSSIPISEQIPAGYDKFARITSKLCGYGYKVKTIYDIFDVQNELLNETMENIITYSYSKRLINDIKKLPKKSTFYDLFSGYLFEINIFYPLINRDTNQDLGKYTNFYNSVPRLVKRNKSDSRLFQQYDKSCMDMFWIINAVNEVVVRPDKRFGVRTYIDAFKVPIIDLLDYANKQFTDIFRGEFPNFVLLVNIFYNYVLDKIIQHLKDYVENVRNRCVVIEKKYPNNSIYNEYIKKFMWVTGEYQQKYSTNLGINPPRMDNFNDNIIYRLILPFNQTNDDIDQLLKPGSLNIRKWNIGTDNNELIESFKKKLYEISKRNYNYPIYINNVIDNFMIQNDEEIQHPPGIRENIVYNDPVKTIDKIYKKMLKSTLESSNIVQKLIKEKEIQNMIDNYSSRLKIFFKELLKNLDVIDFNSYSTDINNLYKEIILWNPSLTESFKMIDYYGGLLSNLKQQQDQFVGFSGDLRGVFNKINALIKENNYLNIPQKYLPSIIKYILDYSSLLQTSESKIKYADFPMTTFTESSDLINNPIKMYLNSFQGNNIAPNLSALKTYHDTIVNYINNLSALTLMQMILQRDNVEKLFDNNLVRVTIPEKITDINIERNDIIDRYRIGEINYHTSIRDPRVPNPGPFLVIEDNKVERSNATVIGVTGPINFNDIDTWRRGMPPSIKSQLSNYIKLLKQKIVQDIIENKLSPAALQSLTDQIAALNPNLTDTNRDIFLKITIGKLADTIIINMIDYSFKRTIIDWVHQLMNDTSITPLQLVPIEKIEYMNILATQIENTEMKNLFNLNKQDIIPYKLNYIEQNPTKMNFISKDPGDKFIHYLYNINYFSDNNIDESSKKCYNINPNIAKMLITSDTINAQNFDGNTPLHYTVENNHSRLAKLLVKHGAKQITNNSGVSPIDMALKNIKVHLEFINYRGSINKALESFSIPFNDSLLVKLRSDLFKNNVIKNITSGVPIQLVMYNHMFHVYTVNHRYGITPELTNDIGIIINGNQPFIFPYDKIILGERLLTYPYDLFDVYLFKKVNKTVEALYKENITDLNKRKMMTLKEELKRINNEIAGYKSEVDVNIPVSLQNEKSIIEQKIKDLKPDATITVPPINDGDYEEYYRLISEHVAKSRREDIVDFYKDMETEIRKKLPNIQMFEVWNTYLNKTISNTETMIFFRIHNIINKLISHYPPKSMKIYQKYFSVISRYMETVKDYIELRNNLPQNLDDNPPLREQFNQLAYLINIVLTPSVYNIIMGELLKNFAEIDMPKKLSENIYKYLHDVLPMKIVKYYTKIYDNDSDPVKRIKNDEELFAPILTEIKTNSIIIYDDTHILIQNAKKYLIPFLTNTYDNFIRTVRTSIYGYERYLLNTYQLTHVLSGLLNI